MVQPLGLYTILWTFLTVTASTGDADRSYNSCVKSCTRNACNNDGLYYVENDIPWALRVMWRCSDDCRYRCMWDVVHRFKTENQPTPQFYGKWPMIRIAGVQEPASAFFSVVNLTINCVMFGKYLSSLTFSSQLVCVWCTYGLVSINCWVWSAVFHTRNILFNEIMDYLSTFVLVVCGAYSIGTRLVIYKPTYRVALSTAAVSAILTHGQYISTGHFDYKYNFYVNTCFGAISVVTSVIFAYQNWNRSHATRFLMLAVTCLGFAFHFEFDDFPPIWWVFDAHAIWHGLTAPSIYYFWRFIIEDTRSF